MKKVFLFAAIFAQAFVASAQETYEMATIETPDLNGSARYVGMGGAMEALGADLSTINSNPAGIGLFRKGQASISFGFVSQGGEEETLGVSPTRMSFDQAGVVFSTNTSDRKVSFLNFAFNYSKSRNFSQILNAANQSVDGSAQNKQTFGKIRSEIVTSPDDNNYNVVDYLYYNADHCGLLNPTDSCFDAQSYNMNRASTGYIGNYDFNISGNIGNKVFLGLTFGIKDVHYDASSAYTEMLVDVYNELSPAVLKDERTITGTGIDFRFGTIIRPFDESPFRVGLWAATPTFYNLRSSCYTRLVAGGESLANEETYRYKFQTPWKFGASIGHTFGQMFAFGATWEYADYSTTSPRIDNGGYYDAWGDYYSSSTKDVEMKYNVKQSLKGSHTLKLGAEIKPVPEFAIRMGYNYVSPIYKETGYKDPAVWSLGNYYTSQTDFTNWKATHRITAGLGYSSRNFFADLAYQYSTQTGDFYPFTSGEFAWTNNEGKNVTMANVPTITEVKNKRHQLLLTLGIKF